MAAHALSTLAPCAPANDDAHHPGPAPCRWTLAISMLQPVWPQAAVFFATQKLRGADFDVTCDQLRTACKQYWVTKNRA